MKIDNEIFWFELDKDIVIARSSIYSIYHDRITKQWVFRYGTMSRTCNEKKGRSIAARLGVKP